jgi:hypothetical protein
MVPEETYCHKRSADAEAAGVKFRKVLGSTPKVTAGAPATATVPTSTTSIASTPFIARMAWSCAGVAWARRVRMAVGVCSCPAGATAGTAVVVGGGVVAVRGARVSRPPDADRFADAAGRDAGRPDAGRPASLRLVRTAVPAPERPETTAAAITPATMSTATSGTSRWSLVA